MACMFNRGLPLAPRFTLGLAGAPAIVSIILIILSIISIAVFPYVILSFPGAGAGYRRPLRLAFKLLTGNRWRFVRGGTLLSFIITVLSIPIALMGQFPLQILLATGSLAKAGIFLSILTLSVSGLLLQTSSSFFTIYTGRVFKSLLDKKRRQLPKKLLEKL